MNKSIIEPFIFEMFSINYLNYPMVCLLPKECHSHVDQMPVIRAIDTKNLSFLKLPSKTKGLQKNPNDLGYKAILHKKIQCADF